MKEASSPFVGLSTRERLEKWNQWHSQHQEEIALPPEPTGDDLRSVSVLLTEKPTESRVRMQPHHSQYDAVVNKIRRACRGAGTFHACSGTDSTRQDSSGSL